ncbi:hypothetical protein BSKO_09040 [Bryopsis sp. KO-2023]|nr:hypothetical protein BSKO_09040 [Bryopsis sp. KO-2023]
MPPTKLHPWIRSPIVHQPLTHLLRFCATLLRITISHWTCVTPRGSPPQPQVQDMPNRHAQQNVHGEATAQLKPYDDMSHAFRTAGFGSKLGQIPANLTWNAGRGEQLWLGGEEQQSVSPLQSFGVCSSNLGLHCLKYHVNSTTPVEAFVVDKIQYEDVQKGEESEYEYVDGSHCLGSQCDRKVRLHFKNWCLVVINADPLFRTADVNYSYQACLSTNDKDHAILILAFSLIVLGVALCVCCFCCYRHGGRRKPYKIHPAAYTSVSSAIHPPDYYPPNTAPLIPHSKEAGAPR